MPGKLASFVSCLRVECASARWLVPEGSEGSGKVLGQEMNVAGLESKSGTSPKGWLVCFIFLYFTSTFIEQLHVCTMSSTMRSIKETLRTVRIALKLWAVGKMRHISKLSENKRSRIWGAWSREGRCLSRRREVGGVTRQCCQTCGGGVPYRQRREGERRR